MIDWNTIQTLRLTVLASVVPPVVLLERNACLSALDASPWAFPSEPSGGYEEGWVRFSILLRLVLQLRELAGTRLMRLLMLNGD